MEYPAKELLKRGFRFKHKTLEEYAEESGGKIKSHPEYDFGIPIGGKIW